MLIAILVVFYQSFKNLSCVTSKESKYPPLKTEEICTERIMKKEAPYFLVIKGKMQCGILPKPSQY